MTKIAPLSSETPQYAAYYAPNPRQKACRDLGACQADYRRLEVHHVSSYRLGALQSVSSYRLSALQSPIVTFLFLGGYVFFYFASKTC